MDLILSYVGTQIWGTRQDHVLLLTSRKSCLVTSRGKLVRAGNAGWDGEEEEEDGGVCARRLPSLPVLFFFFFWLRVDSEAFFFTNCRTAPSSGATVALTVCGAL